MKGHKTFRLRGGTCFPPMELSLTDIRAIGIIAWQKWGNMAADRSMRDLIALAYAEGLYHGANILGSNPNGASSVVEHASSSKMTKIETLNVRELLESL